MKLIPVAEPVLTGRELKYVKECFDTNWISSLGGFILEFEKQFSSYCGTDYGITTSNGTTALHLALHTLGIGRDDEVLVPNLTFIAPANAVAYCGAKPILVDIEPDTWNIDPNKIESKITSKTKAIIPVHLFGHPCDMDSILKIARKYNLLVIEDCAEAHGSLYKNRKVGSFGTISCFSFYGNKIITTGEGGICLTNDPVLAKKLNFLKDHCMDSNKRYWHPEVGFNYRITNIQAAIGLGQLEQIDYFLQRKRENAKLYSSLLQNCTKIVLPVEKDYARHSYWMYSILLDESLEVGRIMEKMRELGVDSRPFFHPISTLPPFRSHNKFEVSERIARQGLTLPSGTNLSAEQIGYICRILKEIVEPD